jgi:hypothetical protein
MALLQDVIGYGTHAARPSAGSAGVLYYETDTDTLFRDNGTSWDALSLGKPSPLTTKGDLWTFGTADARLPVGSNGQVLTADSTQPLGVKWATPSSGGSGTSVLLASKSYQPVSDSTVADVTGTTMTDVDATNAALTFTAPASGKVLVHVSTAGAHDGGSAGNTYWGLREGSTTLAAAWMWGNAVMYGRLSVDLLLTGLSAGSHTVKFAVRCGNAEHIYIFAGPTYGPLVMLAWDAS